MSEPSKKTVKVTVRIDTEEGSGEPPHEPTVLPAADWGLESMRRILSEGQSALRKAPTLGRVRLSLSFSPPLFKQPDATISILRSDRDANSQLQAELAKLDPRLWSRHLIEIQAVKLGSVVMSEPPPAEVATAIKKVLRKK